jgi:hypothetical protein
MDAQLQKILELIGEVDIIMNSLEFERDTKEKLLGAPCRN